MSEIDYALPMTETVIGQEVTYRSTWPAGIVAAVLASAVLGHVGYATAFGEEFFPTFKGEWGFPEYASLAEAGLLLGLISLNISNFIRTPVTHVNDVIEIQDPDIVITPKPRTKRRPRKITH